MPDVRQHAGVGGYCGVVGEGEGIVEMIVDSMKILVTGAKGFVGKNLCAR